jgi:hypothetical protein
MLNRFGDYFSTLEARVPSLATFVLNEIAPYNKDFEVVSATTSKHSACLAPWRIKLWASNSLFRFRLEAIADLTKLRA